jgi:hypothetical protein
MDMNGRTIEPLESRLCLSSHHGGYFHFEAMHYGGGAAGMTATAIATAIATNSVQATPRMPMPKPRLGMPGMHGSMHKFGGGGTRNASDDDGGYQAGDRSYTGGGNVAPVQQKPTVLGVAVIPLPGGGALILPVLNIPPMAKPSTPAVETPASANDNGGTRTLQSPAVTPPNAVTRDVRMADASPARQLLAQTSNLTARDNNTLAAETAARSAFGALGTSAGSVMERLTSKWHDGLVAAAVDVAQASIAHLIVSPEALVSRAVDAASNLLAPVAQTAGSVMSAITPAVATVANVAAYDIAHMGSPFALLADSLAGFVEESASVTNVVAQADKRGPWTLTASVIAADVVVLTYVYRRKSTRRRAQLAPVGID